jgi:hypothetical protein
MADSGDPIVTTGGTAPAPWKTEYANVPPDWWFREPEWFKFVYNTADSDLRAHRIALTYYNLATNLDTALNGGKHCSERAKDPLERLNANWFHFAMWGTLTVTQNVSNQRSPQRLNSGVPAPLRRRLTPAILRARASDGQRVGRALAWGQLAIFVSATQILTEMLKNDGPLSQSDGKVTPEVEKAMSDSVHQRLEDMEALSAISLDAARHISPMTRAFGYYKKAMTVKGAEQAWLTLGANLLLTAAEQDLADLPVEVVLDHIPQHVGAAINWRLAKLSERFRGVPPNLAFALLETMHPNARKLISTIWSRLMTDQVLVMALPTETLRLGRDIPPKHREWPIFPPDLRHIPDVNSKDPKKQEFTNREEIIEIVNLVKSMDRTLDNSGTRGSAARDWRRWDERMNWALALIRSRQQDETLFWAPYSVADQWNIVNGEMPTRVGDASTLDVQAPTARSLIVIAPKQAAG